MNMQINYMQEPERKKIQSLHGASLHRRSAAAGFSLIELMVAVAVLAILATVVTTNVVGRSDQARTTKARSDIATIHGALELYRNDNFNYPSTDQGLEALITKPAGFPEPRNWHEGGYLSTRSIPVDPWGKPYQYISSGNTFELYSFGADGVDGGEGKNADLFYGEQ